MNFHRVSAFNPLTDLTQEFPERLGLPWQQQKVFTCFKRHQTRGQKKIYKTRLSYTCQQIHLDAVASSGSSLLPALFSGEVCFFFVFFLQLSSLPLVQSQAPFNLSHLDLNPSIFAFAKGQSMFTRRRARILQSLLIIFCWQQRRR